MVRRMYNKYEHKIDGWIKIYEKNRWMVGWMDTNRWMVGLIEKKAYEQNDGYKNISIIDGWLDGWMDINNGWLDG